MGQRCSYITYQNYRSKNWKIEELKRLKILYKNNSFKADFQPVIQLNNNELLLGGSEQAIYNIKDKTYDFLSWENNIGRPLAWTIHRDKNQKIWFGFNEVGIGYFDRSDKKLKIYKSFNEFSTLRNSLVYSFLDWDDEHLLIGTASGIFVLNHQKGILQRF